MPDRTSVSALLGPTNTGKTHRAVQHMLEHDTGMIGLPLRLLAREVYDRITSRIGEREVALVTGEEKRVPHGARYWVCTVEAMPMDRPVDFLAVDEIQLSAHRQRGHVFTDRLLNARGLKETWFLGAQTMQRVVSRLLPTAEVRRHPRLSKLRSSGSAGLGQLPPRSAVVAFSMSRVYEIAERLRRRRGGAAVVLGALSPRARNAQVAMYQAGEVDHMVATDAIGMGLNLDLDHVAFADLSKFDGRESRLLDLAELAQIAGRAGRYQNDGSFGTLSPLPPLPLGAARAIERHEFPPERKLVWRSSDVDFSSLAALERSLRAPPGHALLELVERADDFSALTALAERPEIRERAAEESGVRLLWETCQIPDYRQLLPEAHARLVGEVFLQLSGPAGRVDTDWLASHIRRVDDTSGDIDSLLMRMAFVRTWTYVTSHSGWVGDAAHFQGITRDIEDRLSDALHQRLVERFVDRKKSSRSGAGAESADPRRARRTHAAGPFAVLARRLAEAEAAQSPPRAALVSDLVEAPHERFEVDADAVIRVDDLVVGTLTRGSDLLLPEVRLSPDLALGAGDAARLQRRLVAWARDLVSELFSELRGETAAQLSPAARGLVYQLERGLGTLAARDVASQLEQLTQADRAALQAMGVSLGRRVVFVPSLIKPVAVRRRAALWKAHRGGGVSTPAPGAVSVPIGAPGPGARTSYMALGFVPVGGRAVRADALERAERALAQGNLDAEGRARIASLVGCPRAELPALLAALGHAAAPRRRRRRRPRRPAPESPR